MIQSNEKRQFKRYGFDIQIKHNQDDTIQKCQLKDISVDGLFVQSSQKVQMGDAITLNLKIPKQESIITVTGNVVRLAPNGFAIQFDQSDPLTGFTGTIYSLLKNLNLPIQT